MKIRLIMTEDCPRSCTDCCNKQFDMAEVPVLKSVQDIPDDCTMVMLTGGEPMLYPSQICDFSLYLRAEFRQRKKVTTPDIIVYTAGNMKCPECTGLAFSLVGPYVEGFTYTLHEEDDIDPFVDLLNRLPFSRDHSVRLKVFEGISPSDFPSQIPSWLLEWDIGWNCKWIDNCPLPEGEVLMRWGGK